MGTPSRISLHPPPFPAVRTYLLSVWPEDGGELLQFRVQLRRHPGPDDPEPLGDLCATVHPEHLVPELREAVASESELLEVIEYFYFYKIQIKDFLKRLNFPLGGSKAGSPKHLS